MKVIDKGYAWQLLITSSEFHYFHLHVELLNQIGKRVRQVWILSPVKRSKGPSPLGPRGILECKSWRIMIFEFTVPCCWKMCSIAHDKLYIHQVTSKSDSVTIHWLVHKSLNWNYWTHLKITCTERIHRTYPSWEAESTPTLGIIARPRTVSALHH